jgi:uncharacterized membrane protein HdeD (DUF308 family)
MQTLTETRLSRHYWWIVLLRGIIAILFGIVVIALPGVALLVAASFFAAYALIDGIIVVVVAFQERNVASNWWILLIEGLIGVVVGVLAFIFPGRTLIVLIYLIAIWAILTGIAELGGAFMMGRSIGQEWMLIIGGIISIILGILFFVDPINALYTIVLIVGIYAIIFGILLIIRAIRFRSSTPPTAASI